MSNKLIKLRELMRINNVDLLVLGPGTHMRWLLGFNPYPDERPCMLLIGKEK
ncbi:MAG: aminopeptidase P family N-terminal domain-containing protein, partial [Paracoccaceae bacterium]|nr:aminopeptidase P family N-terminal domain-containing protein [Paracoccaceae bacterium]